MSMNEYLVGVPSFLNITQRKYIIRHYKGGQQTSYKRCFVANQTAAQKSTVSFFSDDTFQSLSTVVKNTVQTVTISNEEDDKKKLIVMSERLGTVEFANGQGLR